MTVTYLGPLSRAWQRTREMLFTRFDIEMWLVLGFAAFLAMLADSGLNWEFQRRWRWDDGWSGLPFGRYGSDVDFGALLVLAPLAVLGLVFFVVLLWVSSRAKFIFLEGVLKERGAIVEPWGRFKGLGDSLFIWRAGFWIVGMLIAAMAFAPTIGILGWIFWDDSHFIGPPMFLLGMMSFVIAMIFLFVKLCVESFIVPIMYKHNLTAVAAWKFFLPLLRREPLDFLLYCGFIVVLLIVGWLGLMLLVTVTCCLLLPLIALPYVSSVVLLPVWTTLRLLSLEFLSQYGSAYFEMPPTVLAPEPGGWTPATPAEPAPPTAPTPPPTDPAAPEADEPEPGEPTDPPKPD